MPEVVVLQRGANDWEGVAASTGATACRRAGVLGYVEGWPNSAVGLWKREPEDRPDRSSRGRKEAASGKYKPASYTPLTFGHVNHVTGATLPSTCHRWHAARTCWCRATTSPAKLLPVMPTGTACGKGSSTTTWTQGTYPWASKNDGQERLMSYDVRGRPRPT